MSEVARHACSRSCPRHAALAPVLMGVGWLAAAVAALSVAAIPYDFGESLCGVWGCFPPIPALAAVHLLWVVLLAAGVWAVLRWRRGLLRPVGWVLITASVATAATVLGGDVGAWVERVPAEYKVFWPKRVGYRLATLTDVPIVQALLAGVACVFLGRRSGARRGEVESVASDRISNLE